MKNNIYVGLTYSSFNIDLPLLASWNSWIEAPKSANMEIQIRKWANNNQVVIKSLHSKDCSRDFFDKILGIKRETVFFHIEGEFEKLNELKRILLSIENSWK